MNGYDWHISAGKESHFQFPCMELLTEFEHTVFTKNVIYTWWHLFSEGRNIRVCVGVLCVHKVGMWNVCYSQTVYELFLQTLDKVSGNFNTFCFNDMVRKFAHTSW